jgi:hypothetical protein
MKKLLLALGILALICSPAMAGRNANGAMVVHTIDGMGYSSGWDYCAQNPLPGTLCDVLVPTSNRPVEETETMVWAVGAWLPTSSPGITAYQFGVYHNLPEGYFAAYGPCGPGALQIPDAGFPDLSGTGVAVAYGSAVYPAYLLKMYWFAVYGTAGGQFGLGAYPAVGNAQWADDGSPPFVDNCYRFGVLRWAPDAGFNDCPVLPTEGACCYPDGRCDYVPQTQCQGQFLGVGVQCDPNPCPQPQAACCFPDGHCEFLTALECSGIWEGYGTDCVTFTCPPPPTQACCFADGSCQNLEVPACQDAGGVPGGIDTNCDTYACPQPQACCFTDGSCQDLQVAQCQAQGGNPQGEGTICQTTECPITPTKTTTWGQIKGNYR